MFHTQFVSSDQLRKVRFIALALLLAFSPLFSSFAPAPVSASQQSEPRLVLFLPEKLRNQADAGESPLASLSALSATRRMVDTEINESAPAQNYGFDTALELGHKNLQRQRILLGPSLTKLKPNLTIHQATLRIALCGYYDYIGIARTLTIYRAASLWHQSLATWNNAPALGEVLGQQTLVVPDLDKDGDGYIDAPAWYEFDLTSTVQAWQNETLPNFGVAITGQEAGDNSYLVFCSNDTTYAPELVLSYDYTSPTLAASPASLLFSYSTAQPQPAPAELTISNNGSLPLDWQASAVDTSTGGAADWLSLSLTSGSLIAGTSQTITVTATPPGGEYTPAYTGQIHITSATAGAQGSPQVIAVTLANASASPILSAGPGTLQFSSSDAQPTPASANITITNTGGYPLDWQADVGTASWLGLNFTSGTLAAGASKNVSVTVTPPTGEYHPTYTGQIHVTSTTTGVQGSPQTIAVTFTNGMTPPTLTAAPGNLQFSSSDAQPIPAPQNVTIHNPGGFPLAWQANVGTASWLILKTVSGTLLPGASQNIEVKVTPPEKSTERILKGQVTVTSATGGVLGSPQIIPVTFTNGTVRTLMLPVITNLGAAKSAGLPGAALRAASLAQAAPQKVALVIGIGRYKYIDDIPGAPGASAPGATAPGATVLHHGAFNAAVSARAGEWPSPVEYSGLDGARTEQGLDEAFGDTGECESSPAAQSSRSQSVGCANVLHLEDAQATLANIQAAFAWLDAHEDANTTVFITFAGHGGKRQLGDGSIEEFITAYDTNLVNNTFVNIIPPALLDSWLSQLESTKIVVMLDSCFSGGMSSGIARSGRMVLSASAEDQPSFEVSNLQQGIFSYYLLKAMLDPGADANHDRWVTVEEAFAYLKLGMQDFITTMMDGSIVQTPQIYDGIPGEVNLSYH